MANKPLQSIKFPDLPDTYTIPVVDSTLAVSGAAADAKKTGDSLSDKVDKVSGKGLSTNDYTDEEKTKLGSVETGANKIIIDTTLTQSGQAADAKVVGDEIFDLKEDFSATDKEFADILGIEIGYNSKYDMHLARGKNVVIDSIDLKSDVTYACEIVLNGHTVPAYCYLRDSNDNVIANTTIRSPENDYNLIFTPNADYTGAHLDIEVSTESVTNNLAYANINKVGAVKTIDEITQNVNVNVEQLSFATCDRILHRAYGLVDQTARVWCSVNNKHANCYINTTGYNVVFGDAVIVDISGLTFKDFDNAMVDWSNSRIIVYERDTEDTTTLRTAYYNASDYTAHNWKFTHAVQNVNTGIIKIQLLINITEDYEMPVSRDVYLTCTRLLIHVGKFTADLNVNEVSQARGSYIDLKHRLDRDYNTLMGLINSLSSTVSQGAEIDAYLLREKIPDQYMSYDIDPASFDNDEYLENKIRSVPEGNRVVFFTDTHWNSNEKSTIPIIDYVKKRLEIQYILFGGDILNIEQTGYKAKNEIMAMLYQAKSAFGATFLPVIGNHETNESNMAGTNHTDEERQAHLLPFSQLQAIFTGDIIGRIHTQYDDIKDALPQWANGDSETLNELNAYFKTIYYLDNIVQKIRYVCLNTGNPGNLSDSGLGVISDVFHVGWVGELRLQYEWFSDVLKSTPDGYKVVVCGHQFANEGVTPTVHEGAEPIFQMASAALMKTTVSITPQRVSNNYPIKDWYTNGTHNYDYTNINDISAIVFVCGHSHFDGLSVAGFDSNDTYGYWLYTGETLDQHNKGQIPLILTTTDAYNRYADAPAEVQVPMTLGTTTDHAFDVLTFVEDGIDITRFGAGNDRKVYMQ